MEIKNGVVEKTASHYHYQKTYELISIGNENKIILKRKNDQDPLIFMITKEELFDKLLEAQNLNL